MDVHSYTKHPKKKSFNLRKASGDKPNSMAYKYLFILEHLK